MGAPGAGFLEDDVMARLGFVGQRIHQFTPPSTFLGPSQGSTGGQLPPCYNIRDILFRGATAEP